MSYFKVLGFEKEPFSTSPDPDFFFLSRAHDSALTNILIELRLKRGLSVILGDIGTGKTTLSRKLVSELRRREDFIFYMMLNPFYKTEEAFLIALLSHFEISVDKDPSGLSSADLMNLVERFLLQKAVNEGKTLTLIIDEAQKVSESTLETLRVLLNFETNEYKLFQVVLLGQLELIPKVLNLENFYDRISFKYVLNPFDLDETKEMVRFRLERAGLDPSRRLFSDEAIEEVQKATKGYPRRITMLCHRAIKELIIHKTKSIDASMIRSLVDQEDTSPWKKEGILPKAPY